MNKIKFHLWFGMILWIVAQIPPRLASEWILSGPSQFDVIRGSEQALKISYDYSSSNSDKKDFKISISHEGDVIKSFFDLRNDNQISGTIYLYFLQVSETDVGNYTMYTDFTNNLTITVRGIDAPVELCEVLVFVLPSTIFALAIFAAACAVFYVKKQVKKPKAKKTKKKKHPYMKTGAKITGATNPRQALSVNTITGATPIDPDVPRRSSSLRPPYPVQEHDANSSGANFLQSPRNRQSVNSVDSWDNGEYEYVNTCLDNTSSIDIPTSSRHPYNHSSQHNDEYPHNRHGVPCNTGRHSYRMDNPSFQADGRSRKQESSPTSSCLQSSGRQSPTVKTSPRPMVPNIRANHSSVPTTPVFSRPRNVHNYQNIS